MNPSKKKKWPCKLIWWITALGIYAWREISRDFQELIRKLRLKGSSAFVIGGILLNTISLRLFAAMLLGIVTGSLVSADSSSVFWCRFLMSFGAMIVAGYCLKVGVKIGLYYFSKEYIYGFATAVRTHSWDWVELVIRDGRATPEELESLELAGLPEKLKGLTSEDLLKMKSDLKAFLSFRVQIKRPIIKSTSDYLTTKHKLLWPEYWN